MTHQIRGPAHRVVRGERQGPAVAAPGVGAWPVLVSEFMLQQTPVARVLPAYEAWLARWPTAAALAAATSGDAVRQWDRLGYPRRALRLHACAEDHRRAARR